MVCAEECCMDECMLARLELEDRFVFCRFGNARCEGEPNGGLCADESESVIRLLLPACVLCPVSMCVLLIEPSGPGDVAPNCESMASASIFSFISFSC